MSVICLVVACVLFFLLAIDVLEPTEKGVSVFALASALVALGLAFGAWTPGWWRRGP